MRLWIRKNARVFALVLATVDLILQFSRIAVADVIADPMPNYPGSDELNERMNTPACQRYVQVTHNADPQNPFNTDQLLVYKNGYLVDQYSNKDSDQDSIYTLDSHHVMMSASKPVTATILDATIQAAWTHNGKQVTYNTKLSEFYPYEFRQALLNLRRLQVPDNDREWYEQITLRHLVRMQAGFKWDESYSNPLGDFMSALYLDGIQDIVAASLAVPMERPPGTRFNYSGGNANIMQGIIRTLGQENEGLADANQIAKRILFDRIGIKSAFFEQDQTGSSIGSTYLWLKPQDMARLGHLYLNGGLWRNKKGYEFRILTRDFINGMSTVNTAVDRAVIDEEYLKYIQEEGVPSNSITWLNQDVINNEETVVYAREFPDAPADMFTLAGHNGQLIVVVPSQALVIAITGHNRGYWNKINKIVATTASCFTNLAYAPDAIPHTTYPDASADETSFLKKSKDTLTDLFNNASPATQLLLSPIATGVVAKELCSCMKIVVGTTEPTKDQKRRAIEHCPGDVPQLLQRNYHITFTKAAADQPASVVVDSLTGAFRRQAIVDDHYGCRLVPYSR